MLPALGHQDPDDRDSISQQQDAEDDALSSHARMVDAEEESCLLSTSTAFFDDEHRALLIVLELGGNEVPIVLWGRGAGVGNVVLRMLMGGRRTGEWVAVGACVRQRTRPSAGGRRLVAVDGKTLSWSPILHLTGAANITAALRHHAQRPHRPLQTLKTR